MSTQHYFFAVKVFVETVKQYDTSKYEFAVRETKIFDVIRDVGTFKSEIGIPYLSNSQIVEKAFPSRRRL